MKFLLLVCLVGLQSLVFATDYTGSTPAHLTVRSFLGINLKDSIDFIRWNLRITENKFELRCNYGLCEPGTPGFRNGGSHVTLNGNLTKENQVYTLQLPNRVLKILMLNTNLIHITESDGTPMIGNSGWSYTLNNEQPDKTLNSIIPSTGMSVTDSLVFVGRTPCMPQNFMARSEQCEKVKWLITFYGPAAGGYPSKFKIRSTYKHPQPRYGACAIIKNEKGELLLNLELPDVHLYLKPVSPDVLVFTDKNGIPLVGDKDFGFTLNTKNPKDLY